VAARPDLTVVLVELPPTAERAAARLHEHGVGANVEVVPFVGQRRLERPADCCLLVRVIVTLDDEAAVELLGFARRSLAPGGTIEVVDPGGDGSPAARFGDLFNLARSGGAVRSRKQWEDLARQAGLQVRSSAHVVPPFVRLTLA
jgi:demethylspheroidene O-methyltransferase